MLEESQESPTTNPITFQHMPMKDQGEGLYVTDEENMVSRLNDFYFNVAECEFGEC